MKGPYIPDKIDPDCDGQHVTTLPLQAGDVGQCRKCGRLTGRTGKTSKSAKRVAWPPQEAERRRQGLL